MSTIAEIRRTTTYPEQWEGRLDDGRPIYIRSKNGDIAVRVGPPGGAIEAALAAETLFEGEVDLRTICAMASVVLPPNVIDPS